MMNVLRNNEQKLKMFLSKTENEFCPNVIFLVAQNNFYGDIVDSMTFVKWTICCKLLAPTVCSYAFLCMMPLSIFEEDNEKCGELVKKIMENIFFSSYSVWRPCLH